MYAYKVEVVIPANHQVVLSLPSDMPAGKAEVVILVEEENTGTMPLSTEAQAPSLSWIDELLANVPPAPEIPLEALRRENMYGDDGR
jgi:hypothetical protein